ncbi:Hypothetical protein Tpal_1781 [Trichococcus palustris]|uniref:Uncharacterized protein n=2 Tax=Trichococcus palustris TaxID=140314 RepID=A0A143YMX6_9LACT|nr:Hypothetical protein Tpal_1781 [Trichococcus palustris]SFK91747.1 uncharacterized protein SAMN04488076_10921 [Trichococcus palustris]
MTKVFFTSIIQFVILGVMEMKWPLKELQEHRGEPHYFSVIVDRESSLMTRNNEIQAVSPIKAEGFLLYENHSVLANFRIDLTITLPSSRSLELVEVPMQIAIEELYTENESLFLEQDNPAEVVLPLEGDEVDLIPAIEDNILLNLPLQVYTAEELKSDQMPSGADWVVISEESFETKRLEEKSNQIDPRLAGLKALLEDEEKTE